MANKEVVLYNSRHEEELYSGFFQNYLGETSEEWGHDTFRKALIFSAVLGTWPPASLMPDSLTLSEKVVKDLAFLRTRTDKEEREWCTFYHVDVQRQCLLRGKTTGGHKHGVEGDWTQEKGKEGFQRRSMLVHTHLRREGKDELAFGLFDLRNFLTDNEMTAAVVSVGDSCWMALKTSRTGLFMDLWDIDKVVSEIHDERVGLPMDLMGKDVDPLKVMEFNIRVCEFFGLVLYRGGQDGRMKRVSLSGG